MCVWLYVCIYTWAKLNDGIQRLYDILIYTCTRREAKILKGSKGTKEGMIGEVKGYWYNS